MWKVAFVRCVKGSVRYKKKSSRGSFFVLALELVGGSIKLFLIIGLNWFTKTKSVRFFISSGRVCRTALSNRLFS